MDASFLISNTYIRVAAATLGILAINTFAVLTVARTAAKEVVHGRDVQRLIESFLWVLLAVLCSSVLGVSVLLAKDSYEEKVHTAFVFLLPVIFTSVGRYCTIYSRATAVIRQTEIRFIRWRFWLDSNPDQGFLDCVRTALFRSNIMIGANLTLIEVAFLLGGDSSHLQSDDWRVPRFLLPIIGILQPFIISFVIAWIWCKIPRWARPSGVLLEKTYIALILLQQRQRLPNNARKFTLTGWRNDIHVNMFSVARSIEDCVPKIKQALSSQDYKVVATSYLDLAEAIREEGVRCVGKSSSVRARWLLLMASTLVLNSDPVSAAQRIKKIVPSTGPAIPEAATPVRVLAKMNEGIDNQKNIIYALGFGVVVAYYLSLGQYQEFIKFVSSLLGG